MPTILNQDVVALLACPACKGRLVLDAGLGALCCTVCHLRYPVVDGVPVLLVSAAYADGDSPAPVLR